MHRWVSENGSENRSEWVSEWVGGWVGGWVGEWVSGWVGEWVSGWVGGWVGEWVSGWVNGWVGERVSGWVGEWVSGWVGEWVSGWVGEWVSGWVSEWVSEWAREEENDIDGKAMVGEFMCMYVCKWCVCVCMCEWVSLCVCVCDVCVNDVCVWYAVFMLCVPVDIREYVSVGVHACVYVRPKGRQGVHPTPWQCTVSHACHAKEAETQGTPGRTSDPLAMHSVPGLPRKRGGDPRDATAYIRSLGNTQCPTPATQKRRRPKGRQGVHPTPWQCTVSHACHAKEAETQGTPGRTSDPLAMHIVPRLPRKRGGDPRDARAYIRSFGNAQCPTPAAQKRRRPKVSVKWVSENVSGWVSEWVIEWVSEWVSECPRGVSEWCESVCVCVWNIWKDVKLLPDDVRLLLHGSFWWILNPVFLTALLHRSFLSRGAISCLQLIAQRRGLHSWLIWLRDAGVTYLPIFQKWEEAQPKNLHVVYLECSICCTVVAIWNLFWSITDWAASELSEPSSKDVESILHTEFHVGSTSFPVRFYWNVFAREMHSTTEIRNDVSEQVCHSCCVRQVGRNPSGKAFLG